MKAQFFIYTRGFSIENDYRLMYIPASDFCPDTIRKYFLGQVRGAINIETYSGDLKEPRWLFSHKGDMVLWGMAIMNNVLSEENTSDYTGRSVRGFFGFVTKFGTYDTLPFDIRYFRKMYASLVSPLWSASKDNFRKKGVWCDDSFDGFETITATTSSSIQINVNPSRVVIWGKDYSIVDLLSNALSLSGETTMITGLAETGHAYNPDYHYLNAQVDGVTSNEDTFYKPVIQPEDIPTQQKSNNNGDERSITTIDSSKKVYRPRRNLPRMLAILLLLAIAGMCMKGIKKSKPSTSSGEQVSCEKTLDSTKIPTMTHK